MLALTEERPDTRQVSAEYNRRQLMQIARMVEAHADEFEARWRDYFD